MKATKMLSGLVCWPMLGDGGEGGPNGVQWAAGRALAILSRANKKRHTIFTVRGYARRDGLPPSSFIGPSIGPLAAAAMSSGEASVLERARAAPTADAMASAPSAVQITVCYPPGPGRMSFHHDSCPTSIKVGQVSSDAALLALPFFCKCPRDSAAQALDLLCVD